MATKKKPRSIADLLLGRFLSGILIEGSELSLRFRDARIKIDLNERSWRFGANPGYWLTFPGLLRVVRVIEDRTQIILVVSGALYTSEIAVRQKKGGWQLVFDANFVA